MTVTKYTKDVRTITITRKKHLFSYIVFYSLITMSHIYACTLATTGMACWYLRDWVRSSDDGTGVWRWSNADEFCFFKHNAMQINTLSSLVLTRHFTVCVPFIRSLNQQLLKHRKVTFSAEKKAIEALNKLATYRVVL